MGVNVGVFVGVGVQFALVVAAADWAVAVTELPGVGVKVGVGVIVGVGVTVGVGVFVGIGVAVGVGEDVGVRVGPFGSIMVMEPFLYETDSAFPWRSSKLSTEIVRSVR